MAALDPGRVSVIVTEAADTVAKLADRLVLAEDFDGAAAARQVAVELLRLAYDALGQPHPPSIADPLGERK